MVSYKSIWNNGYYTLCVQPIICVFDMMLANYRWRSKGQIPIRQSWGHVLKPPLMCYGTFDKSLSISFSICKTRVMVINPHFMASHGKQTSYCVWQTESPQETTDTSQLYSKGHNNIKSFFDFHNHTITYKE